MTARTLHRIGLFGWILFILSALFFMGASLRFDDLIGFLGGLFFLLGCLVFLALYLRPATGRD